MVDALKGRELAYSFKLLLSGLISKDCCLAAFGEQSPQSLGTIKQGLRAARAFLVSMGTLKSSKLLFCRIFFKKTGFPWDPWPPKPF